MAEGGGGEKWVGPVATCNTFLRFNGTFGAVMRLKDCQDGRISMDRPGRHFIIVDDDKDVRYFIRRVIQRRFTSVEIGEASDGLEALKLFEHGGADLMVIDHNLPLLSGRTRPRSTRPQHDNADCDGVKFSAAYGREAMTQNLPYVVCQQGRNQSRVGRPTGEPAGGGRRRRRSATDQDNHNTDGIGIPRLSPSGVPITVCSFREPKVFPATFLAMDFLPVVLPPSIGQKSYCQALHPRQ